MILTLLAISQIFTMLISLVAMFTAIGVAMRFQKSQKLAEMKENIKDQPVNVTKDELEKLIREVANQHLAEILKPMKESLIDQGRIQ